MPISYSFWVCATICDPTQGFSGFYRGVSAFKIRNLEVTYKMFFFMKLFFRKLKN